MLEQEITFDQLPQAVATLMEDVCELKHICRAILNEAPSKEVWFNVEQLIAYLPSHPSSSTIYRWRQEGTIPYYKNDVTRALRFKKTEIDEWLLDGRYMSLSEKIAQQDAEILAKRQAKRQAKQQQEEDEEGGSND